MEKSRILLGRRCTEYEIYLSRSELSCSILISRNEFVDIIASLLIMPRTSKARIQEVLTAILEIYPDKQIELIYETPFQLLIAVMLSAQTTDKQVNRVTPEFFALVHEPEDLKDWDIERIEGYLSRVNFYHNKSAHILKTAKILREEFDSVIPDTLNKIITLP